MGKSRVAGGELRLTIRAQPSFKQSKTPGCSLAISLYQTKEITFTPIPGIPEHMENLIGKDPLIFLFLDKNFLRI